MAKGTFEAALSLVLKHEGGWADHPSDPGGATMKGVTLATYRRYRPNATKSDLRNINGEELRMIYRGGYWNAVRGDDLPAGLDYAVFDYAVNSGPARAAMHLQEIVGVAQDGKIGPVTLAAVAKHSPANLINALCDRRMRFLRSLSTFPVFGRGWTSRVESVRSQALGMVRADTPAPRPGAQPGSPPNPGIIPAVIVILAVLVAAFFLLKSIGQ